VGSLRVVKRNPVFDHAFGLESAPQFVQIDGLLFERPPSPFDEGIVETPAPSIHQDFRPAQGSPKRLALSTLKKLHD
jgi:hypothetical protein